MLVFVCVRGFTCVARVGLLVLLSFEYSQDTRACFVSVFSCTCTRSPRAACIQRLTRRHDYFGIVLFDNQLVLVAASCLDCAYVCC